MPEDDEPAGVGRTAASREPGPVPSRWSAGNGDLRRSLEALSTLASAELDLEQLLTRVAHYAVQAIPGAEGSGLTLLETGRSSTIVATDPFVQEIDDIQYGLMQGPCVSAAATGHTVRSGSLGNDDRWPQFGSRVARLGVHSAVSLPLVAGGEVVGAMNVYARPKHTFDDRAVELGELFTAPAAVTAQNAQALAQAVRLTEELRGVLSTQRVLDRAVGIVMSRSCVTEHEALERLRSISQRERRKLLDVAQQVTDEAVRRARNRRADP